MSEPLTIDPRIPIIAIKRTVEGYFVIFDGDGEHIYESADNAFDYIARQCNRYRMLQHQYDEKP